MKKVAQLILAALLVPCTSFAKGDVCEYFPEAANPDSNEKIIKTEWDRLSSKMGMMMGAPSTQGAVRGISRGESTFLGVQMLATSYHPIPPELGVSLESNNMITKTGIYDRRLNPFAKEIQTDALVVPAGSRLRITMEDRTTIILTTSEEVRAHGSSTRPLSSDNQTQNFRVKAEAMLEYTLDADALAALTAKPAIHMRLESRDRYHDFGGGMTATSSNAWSEKYNGKIQRVLGCVQ